MTDHRPQEPPDRSSDAPAESGAAGEAGEAGEAVVRRLLAEAGGPLPMPADVAERLDAVLLDLQRERSRPGVEAATTTGTVTALRARRRWPRLVLAAAAVVVGGYGVGTVVTQGTLSGTDDAMSAGAESADSDSLLVDEEPRTGLRAERDRKAGGDQPGGQAEGGVTSQDAPTEATEDSAAFLQRPVRVRSDSFDVDVRRALRLLEREVSLTADLRQEEYSVRRSPADCELPSLTGGERSLSVRYDGVAGVLVAGRQRDGQVPVTVYDCAGAVLADTVVDR